MLAVAVVGAGSGIYIQRRWRWLIKQVPLVAEHDIFSGEGFDFVLMSTNDLHSAFEGSGPDHAFTPHPGLERDEREMRER